MHRQIDLPHEGRCTDSIDHIWASVKIAQREQKLATRNHRQVSKINVRKFAFHPCFLLDNRSWRRGSKRKTDAIQIYSWHASTMIYDS